MSSESPYQVKWLTGPSNTQFYTRLYPATSSLKAVVLFIHGFAEHIGRYEHFHTRFATEGIALFAFDQRGYGRTAQDDEGNKSRDSAYGKTSWKDQMQHIDWALGYVRTEFAGVPLFLMGHSMGGGEVLGFSSQGAIAPTQKHVSKLAGVIATSPLLKQAKPASKILRRVGGLIGMLSPHTLIPAAVVPSHLSRNPKVGEDYLKDKFVRQEGSLRGIGDMLSKGEEVLQAHWKNWPKTLPLLLVHGTSDQVTSHEATKQFFSNVPAQTKDLKLVEGGYHELQNDLQEVQDQLLADILSFINSHIPVTQVQAAQEVPKAAL